MPFSPRPLCSAPCSSGEKRSIKCYYHHDTFTKVPAADGNVNRFVGRLREAAARLEARGVRVTAPAPASGPLRLGELWGNRFRVTLRGVAAPEVIPLPNAAAAATGSSSVAAAADANIAAVRDRVEQSVRGVVEHGFINYYGPQRFGASQSVKTDEIGKHLLKGELDKALKLFFCPEAGDDAVNQARRTFLETGDARLALSLMPAHRTREHLMLRALRRCGPPRDGSGVSDGGSGGTAERAERAARAWMALPRPARLFYPHAYCSALWNRAASARARLHGARGPVRGDLVLPPGDAASRRGGTVHVVTEEEEANGVYTIDQVVLPMPGSSVRYPDNEVGAAYRSMLRRDGLADSTFRVAELRLSLPGVYRRLLARPTNVSLGWSGRGLPGAAVTIGRSGATGPAGATALAGPPSHASRLGWAGASGFGPKTAGPACPASDDSAAGDPASENRTSPSRSPAPDGSADARPTSSFNAENASADVAGGGSGLRLADDIAEGLGPAEASAVGSSLSLVVTFDLPSSCYATACLAEMMKRQVS